MEDKFFDENQLRDIEISDEIRADYDKLNFNFKELEGSKYFFCQVGEMRINSADIKALIK